MSELELIENFTRTLILMQCGQTVKCFFENHGKNFPIQKKPQNYLETMSIVRPTPPPSVRSLSVQTHRISRISGRRETSGNPSLSNCLESILPRLLQRRLFRGLNRCGSRATRQKHSLSHKQLLLINSPTNAYGTDTSGGKVNRLVHWRESFSSAQFLSGI